MPDKYTEKEHKAELNQFREIAKNSLVCLWNNKGDLTKDVVLSLLGEFRTHPRIGWMRADEKSSSEQNKEILRLKSEIDALQAQIKTYEENGPEGTEDLCQGEDEFEIEYQAGLSKKAGKISLSWNQICSLLLPKLLNDCMENVMKITLNEYIAHVQGNDFVHMSDYAFQTIKVQLLALGYIEESVSPKSKKDYVGIWRLTKYGTTVLLRLKAQRKS